MTLSIPSFKYHITILWDLLIVCSLHFVFVAQLCICFIFVRALKQRIDRDMKNFLKLYLELFAAHHSLQQKMACINSECDTLLARTADILQVATDVRCEEIPWYFFAAYVGC
jgi:hypothetical protein